mgnify:CR=1 FL=1
MEQARLPSAIPIVVQSGGAIDVTNALSQTENSIPEGGAPQQSQGDTSKAGTDTQQPAEEQERTASAEPPIQAGEQATSGADSTKVTPATKVDVQTAQTGQIQKFTNFAEGKLQEHFEKHVIKRGEWGNPCSTTLENYLKKAQNLINSPIGGDIEGFISKNGFTFRYNTATNEFATANPSGIIETIYRPKRGITYWLEQITKYK